MPAKKMKNREKEVLEANECGSTPYEHSKYFSLNSLLASTCSRSKAMTTKWYGEWPCGDFEQVTDAL
jgi:hypothetical protein